VLCSGGLCWLRRRVSAASGGGSWQSGLDDEAAAESRRSTPFPGFARTRLDEVLVAHSSLPAPASLGRKLQIGRGADPVSS